MDRVWIKRNIFCFASTIVMASSGFAAAQANTNINVPAPNTNVNTTTTIAKAKRHYKTSTIKNKVSLVQEQSKRSQTKPSAPSLSMVVGNQPYNVTLHGYINQVAWGANDGARWRVFYGNNTFMDSRFKIGIAPVVPQPISFFSNVEIAVRNNSSNAVSQRVQSINSLFIRIAEVGIDFTKYGKIYLGLGPTASDYTAESDLSGTYGYIVDSGVQKLGGGLFFNNAATNTLTGSPIVNAAFDNLDGLSRLGRFRYDTPTYAGVHLEASLIERNDRDIAIKFLKDFEEVTVMASAAFANDNLLNILFGTVKGNTVDGSGSIRFKNGLNFSAAGGAVTGTPPGRDTPAYYYIKPGYRANLTSQGKTDFVLDYGNFNNYARNDDKGKTFGFAVSQNFDAWDASLYAGYRLFKLSRVGTKFDNINIVAAGGVIKF